MDGSNEDDARSRVPLVCLSTLVPATSVFAENPKGCQPPLPLLGKNPTKWPFSGSPHSSAVLVCQAGAQHPWKSLRWGQPWVREWSHTHLSPSSQSDPESANWKHTCKSVRAGMWGFFYNLPVWLLFLEWEVGEEEPGKCWFCRVETRSLLRDPPLWVSALSQLISKPAENLTKSSINSIASRWKLGQGESIPFDVKEGKARAGKHQLESETCLPHWALLFRNIYWKCPITKFLFCGSYFWELIVNAAVNWSCFDQKCALPSIFLFSDSSDASFPESGFRYCKYVNLKLVFQVYFLLSAHASLFLQALLILVSVSY